MGRYPMPNIDKAKRDKNGASDAHTNSENLEMHLSVSQRDGGIAQAFCAVQSAERKAMIGVHVLAL